jgi:Domain of unknown function (DUF4384)
MGKASFGRPRSATLLCVLLVASGSVVVRGQDDRSRSIVPESFLKARPAAPRTPTPNRGATYRRVSQTKPPADAKGVTELGITIWRLRPTGPGDTARLLVQEPQAAAEQWTPERVEVGKPLAIGDRVRIAIESPRAGYLYVIDREQYGDGTTSDPYLIFPTTRARGGDNKVVAGRLTEIPAQTDAPPYFTLRASRPDQTAELITVLVSQEPLPDVMPGASASLLKPDTVAAWIKGGGRIVEQLEMNGGAGRAWSEEEQRAGADGTRLLTQHDPPPQTVFRVLTTSPALVAAQFTLSHAKARASDGIPGKR